MSKPHKHEHNERSAPLGKQGAFYAFTIFLSAFLLFLIQPMVSKFILPWYGGSPTVWTTCMLFYQTVLLAGYAYAHLLTKKFSVRTQVIIHSSLLLLSMIQLPPTPSEGWREMAQNQPILSILGLLTTTLGLPYVLLSATSPLLQKWFSASFPHNSPYRLYALSNVGSLLALVSFPFLIEPNFTRHIQANFWSAGLLLFIACCCYTGWMLYRSGISTTTEQLRRDESNERNASLSHRILWIALPATASVMLLATTNKVCQEIVVFPLLWILPLALYLLSFIICFDKPAWYSRKIFFSLFVLLLAGVAWCYVNEKNLTLVPVVAIFPAFMFTVCMICHGETMKLKPGVTQLTAYYLYIAFGGALGSIFVVLIAPLLFNDYSEYHIGIFLAVMLMMTVVYADRQKKSFNKKSKIFLVANIVVVLSGAIGFQIARTMSNENVLAKSRSFFGILRVGEYERFGKELAYRVLNHGSILHGMQFLDARFKKLPTTYYAAEGGLGVTIQHYPQIESLKIGVVGLGVGTIAAWLDKTDTLKFYEINPDVITMANNYFTYLKETEGKVDIVLGDARLSLEKEPPQLFDFLVLDAFNSDSPPVHLLTKEAFTLYKSHIKNGGVIAVHISCKYLDFYPIVSEIAKAVKMNHRLLTDPNSDDAPHRKESTWVILTNNKELLYNSEYNALCVSEPETYSVPMWTDEYSSLLPIFIWE